jgi:hypothetical protein
VVNGENAATQQINNHFLLEQAFGAEGINIGFFSFIGGVQMKYFLNALLEIQHHVVNALI